MEEIINEINPELKKKLEAGEISRGQFLKQLGLSSATLMAFYCMGTGLSACSKADDPAPVNPGGGNSSKIDFTLDLTTNDFKELKNDGGFAIKDSIIIANVAGKYAAISKACSHEGTTIAFRAANADFRCPNHGAVYATDGVVKIGPNGGSASSTSALKAYKTETLDSGNKLRVFE